MADDPVDISGMPDPTSIGLSPSSQADPTVGMPEPKDLYRQFHGYDASSPEEIDAFMKNPQDERMNAHGYKPGESFRHGASALTGLPRAAAGLALAVPAAVAGGAGALTGAAGAALDPENAAEHLETGRERLRNWSAGTYNLANYIPATKRGAEAAQTLMSLPTDVGHAVNQDMVAPVVGDNASQMIGDVFQDVGTVAPALGAPAAVRAGVKGVRAGAGAAKNFVKGEAASLTPPEPTSPLTPDVGSPVTGNSLRAQQNPIPAPEGTLHHTLTEEGHSPAAPEPTTPPPVAGTPEIAASGASPAAASSADPVIAAAAKASDPFRFANGTMNAERGSTRLFDQPKNSGPQETPATPEERIDNTATLDALDKLSGGSLPTRRASAIAGDYNATGNDWQAAKTGNESAQRQLASENDALHAAIDNVHKSTGSLSDDSVDPVTLGDRGRTTRGAIQAIEGFFDKATDQAYDQARAVHGNQPMPQFLNRANDFLADDANYMPDSFRKSAQSRLNQLKTVGDKGDGTENSAVSPGSVGAAEKFREWLNANRTMDNAHVVKQLKDHTDTDVSEQGGPGLFATARAMRTHQARMLEEPVGIRKLLAPADSQGINHAIPEHKVMDYINDLPREQHEHVMNVLRAGAHLGGGELAESSADAIREIQAHTVSRLHDAATDDGGKWNARSFASAATRYARNAESTFRERPDILRNLETVKKAGDVLHMDKSYPGAAGQAVRSGLLTGAVKGAGAIASSLAHEVPVVGRILGRGIEGATEAATGDIGKKAAEKAFEGRLVDRTGKQRGAVGDLSQRDAIAHASRTDGNEEGTTTHRYTVPSKGGSMNVVERPGLGVSQVQTSNVVDKGKGWGTRMLQRAADDAHARGQILHSDHNVSEGQVGAYKNLATLGYDVKEMGNSRHTGSREAWGDHVFEVRPGKVKAPSGQRGSFSFQNDNALNRATAGARAGQRGVGASERNPRSEYNANRQIAGNPAETAERADILRRLSGQRGSVKVMNEAPRTAEEGSQLNIGLHQGTEGEPGFRKMSKQEAQAAVESTGAKVTKSTVLTPKAHGVAEPTAVLSTDRPLTDHEMQGVLAKTKQSAIPQRTEAGEESMHVAPGHEEIAKEQGWDKFNPEYFRDHEGAPHTLKDSRAIADHIRDTSPGFVDHERIENEFKGHHAVLQQTPVDSLKTGDENGNVADARKQIKYNKMDPKTAPPIVTENGEVIDGNHRLRAARAAGAKTISAYDIRPNNQRDSVRVMNEKPLAGAPEGDQPNGKARAAAAAYAKGAGIDYKPLDEYRYVDPKVAKSVADAYDEMKHDPSNPKVAKSYDAFKAETLAQYKQMQKAGVKVDLDPSYPYKNPREMHEDVRDNNHMSIYPTEAGFGSSDAAPSDHPLMEKAPVKMGGKDATYNDLFRAVHDYYGHAAEGNGFRANGEYNAWRAHRQMYSPEARGAMDSETLGQNSWVNSGPAAALNKGASGADTIYADQKAGLLPPKVVKAAEEGVGADEHHITNQLTDDERNQLRADTTKRLVEAFHGAPATKEYAAAALAGAAKRGWYRNSAQSIVNQFGPDAPRFAGLLSAMSPQVSVQTNFANALKTFINWDKAGRPEDPGEIRKIMEASSQKSATAAPGSSNVLDAWVNNAVRALTADDPSNIKLSGPKVHSFYHNLTGKVNEVTNDAWMASFAKIDPIAAGSKMFGSLNKAGPGKTPTYLAMSAKVRDAARMLSHLTGETWTPAEVQETVWSWAKTAYEHAEEKGDRSIPELVKNGDITDDLIRSTPDFHQLFGTSEHRGLLQSSRFAGNAEQLAAGKEQDANAAGSSKARQAAESALRPHLISAAERLEQVRQERRN